jgi:hypothetical protein
MLRKVWKRVGSSKKNNGYWIWERREVAVEFDKVLTEYYSEDYLGFN